jgi:hypothetical protein
MIGSREKRGAAFWLPRSSIDHTLACWNDIWLRGERAGC